MNLAGPQNPAGGGIRLGNCILKTHSKWGKDFVLRMNAILVPHNKPGKNRNRNLNQKIGLMLLKNWSGQPPIKIIGLFWDMKKKWESDERVWLQSNGLLIFIKYIHMYRCVYINIYIYIYIYMYRCVCIYI